MHDKSLTQTQAPFPQPASPPPPPPGQQPPPPPLVIPPGKPGAVQSPKQEKEEEDFTFRNLERVQYFEERANEIFPVLEANINILTEMREHYQSILTSRDCPDKIRTESNAEFAQFEKRITTIITNLQRQSSRTKMLLKLLSDRKGLVSPAKIEATDVELNPCSYMAF